MGWLFESQHANQPSVLWRRGPVRALSTTLILPGAQWKWHGHHMRATQSPEPLGTSRRRRRPDRAFGQAAERLLLESHLRSRVAAMIVFKGLTHTIDVG